MTNRIRLWLLACSLLLISVVGCATVPASAGASPYIDFTVVDPTIVERPLEGENPLRVAIAAVISPQGTAESYRLLLDYLETALNRPVVLVQRRTYREINDLIEHDQVDLAFVCTSAYVEGHDTFGMRLLVAPQVNGQTVYRSLLIVPADSTAQSIRDLAGSTFAFTDPISTTGRAYPTYLLNQLGYEPETFFRRIFYTYSHDDAIRAVANNIADAAGVDSLVYEFALRREPELAERVRVIHESPPFGIPPVVVGPHVPAAWLTTLRDLFLNMSQDPAGQEALAAIGVERFVLIDDAAYDSVREMRARVRLGP